MAIRIRRPNLGQSYGVLTAIELELELDPFQDMAQELTLSHYANMREQGFHLRYDPNPRLAVPGRAVSFATNRSSDDIVVWYGYRAGFNPANGVPTFDGAVCSKMFPYGHIRDAARFILNWLLFEDTNRIP